MRLLTTLARWLGNVKEMAPDIFDQLAMALSKPLEGVDSGVRVVAEKARQG